MALHALFYKGYNVLFTGWKRCGEMTQAGFKSTLSGGLAAQWLAFKNGKQIYVNCPSDGGQEGYYESGARFAIQEVLPMALDETPYAFVNRLSDLQTEGLARLITLLDEGSKEPIDGDV